MLASDCIQLQHGTALARLREAILSGEIPPGTKIVQEDLARRFSMSRIPLREALRTLEAEGLVLSEPRKGARCRPLEPKDLDDLYALRLSLERLAVRRAALGYANLRLETAAKGRIAARMLERGDRTGLFYLDRDFHDGIAVASGNAHVARALSMSWSQIMRAMHVYFKLNSYPDQVWSEHNAIAQAISLGDPDRAEHLLADHIAHSRDIILRGLREHAT